MMVAKLDIAVSQILDCHDGLFGSIQALHLLVLLKAAAGGAIKKEETRFTKRVMLFTVAPVPLSAEKRYTIYYCISAIYSNNSTFSISSWRCH